MGDTITTTLRTLLTDEAREVDCETESTVTYEVLGDETPAKPVVSYYTCASCGAHPLQVVKRYDNDRGDWVYPCSACGHIPGNES